MFSKPQVSVIVSNYNYAPFIEECVASVFAQSYGNVECVIVDDNSTDSSRTVLSELAARFTALKIVYRDRNGGQSASILDGLRVSAGEYVVLLDADDVLMPDCVSLHLWTHMTLRIPVGFSSGDMIQARGNEIVTTGSQHFAKFFEENHERTRAFVRPVDPFLSGILGDLGRPVPAVCLVEPHQSSAWPWSPTSANCFRRAALTLLCDNPGFQDLRSCSDCYLLHGVSAISGSVLIDAPVAFYRLHGSNGFASCANLNRVRGYDTALLKTRSDQAISALLDYLFENVRVFATRLEDPGMFQDIVDTIDNVYPRICLDGPSYATRRMLEHWETLEACLGEERMRYWMLRKVDGADHGLIWRSDRIGKLLFNRVFLPSLRKKVVDHPCGQILNKRPLQTRS